MLLHRYTRPVSVGVQSGGSKTDNEVKGVDRASFYRKGGEIMQTKGYEGRISNKGSQEVSAVFPTEKPKSPKVIIGGDLRARPVKKTVIKTVKD